MWFLSKDALVLVCRGATGAGAVVINIVQVGTTPRSTKHRGLITQMRISMRIRILGNIGENTPYINRVGAYMRTRYIRSYSCSS